jgi:hypothetical protein
VPVIQLTPSQQLSISDGDTPEVKMGRRMLVIDTPELPFPAWALERGKIVTPSPAFTFAEEPPESFGGSVVGRAALRAAIEEMTAGARRAAATAWEVRWPGMPTRTNRRCRWSRRDSRHGWLPGWRCAAPP